MKVLFLSFVVFAVSQLMGMDEYPDPDPDPDIITERSLVKVECFESVDHVKGSPLLGFRVKSDMAVYSLPIAQEFLHLKSREQIKDSIHFILSTIISDSLHSKEIKFLITKLQSDENQTEAIITFLYSRSRTSSVYSIFNYFVLGWGEAH